MHFVLVGLSHKTAPLDVRERLAVPESQVPEALGRLLQNEDIQEGMLISTCNRVEACLVAKHIQRAVEGARGFFSKVGALSEEELKRYLYVREEGAAVAHLFRVAASLDSMVVGEPQISGQVKEAYTRAVAGHGTGPYLNKLVHKALQVSKKIRNETAIGRLPVSISFAACLLAEKIFGNLKSSKVILLGAGEMGELAVKHLRERQAGEIWISNRTRERAEGLASELGATLLPFEEIFRKMAEADIVIASTAAEEYLIREPDIREVMKRRRNRPVFLIDIAVPRNIDPRVNTIENVYLYDIDHLQGIVEANVREREREAKRAEGIIESEVQNFLRDLAGRQLSPTIRELSEKFDLIRRRELGKYLLRRPDLSPEHREALEGMTKSIIGKILHDPIILMKTEEPRDGAPRYSEILRKLFKLEG